MAKYLHRDAVELAYQANKKRLRAEGQIVLDRVMNEALHEMTNQFNAALGRGELLELDGTREEMERYLRTAATRQLGDGGDDAE